MSAEQLAYAAVDVEVLVDLIGPLGGLIRLGVASASDPTAG